MGFRLYGTFPDDVDCGVFWKCQDGKPNKYNCPPGLAYDSVHPIRSSSKLIVSCLNCFIVPFLIGCFCVAYDSVYQYVWPMTCTHCSVLIVLPSLLPTTCIWLASIVRLFQTPSHAQVSRGCRWADQVPECSTNSVVVGDHLKDYTNYNRVTKLYYLVTNAQYGSKTIALQKILSAKTCPP